MEYKKSVTAAKVATPAIVIMGGAKAVQLIGAQMGFTVTDEISFQIITGIYSMGAGFINWIKNRKRR